MRLYLQKAVCKARVGSLNCSRLQRTDFSNLKDHYYVSWDFKGFENESNLQQARVQSSKLDIFERVDHSSKCEDSHFHFCD